MRGWPSSETDRVGDGMGYEFLALAQPRLVYVASAETINGLLPVVGNDAGEGSVGSLAGVKPDADNA